MNASLISPLARKLCAAGVFAVATLALSNAAVITYNFNGTGAAANWTNTQSLTTPGSISDFTQNGSGEYVGTTTAGNNGQAILASLFDTSSYRADGTNFSISMVFDINTLTASGSYNGQVGIKFLATSGTETASDSYYNISIGTGNAGTEHDITINRRSGATSATVVDSGVSFGFLTATGSPIYTITLNGTYNGSGHLTLGYDILRNGVSQYSNANAYTDTAPISGDLFGIRSRSRAFSGANSLTITPGVDNYALTYVAVPEPNVVACAIFGLGAMCLIRRRKPVVLQLTP